MSARFRCDTVCVFGSNGSAARPQGADSKAPFEQYSVSNVSSSSPSSSSYLLSCLRSRWPARGAGGEIRFRFQSRFWAISEIWSPLSVDPLPSSRSTCLTPPTATASTRFTSLLVQIAPVFLSSKPCYAEAPPITKPSAAAHPSLSPRAILVRPSSHLVA